MNTSLHVRTAELEDADEISRLCAELGYAATHEEIQSRLDYLLGQADHYIAVAEDEQRRVVGWIAAEHRHLLESGERVEIVGLVVQSESRKAGVGRLLVGHVEDWTRSRGLTRVFVRSNVARRASHDFYRGLGFEHAKTQHAYAKDV